MRDLVFLAALALGAAGCGKGSDADGDGVPESEDCDDLDATAFPGNAEVCDGVDNNCDGTIDEGMTVTLYTDADGDGFGDAAAAVDACDIGNGLVANAADCDDANEASYPGAAEICDENDNDCDGDIDEDSEVLFYADTDGDGYGDPDVTSMGCDPDEGFVADATDCDDTRENAFPGAPELCDEVDNDCDGDVDEEPTDGTIYYPDTDGDGQGDENLPTPACTLPEGYSENGEDCDDAVATTYTGAPELCDEVDNDCDGETDEDDAVDPTTWYADGDGDGYGVDDDTVVQCDSPGSGYSDLGGDCADGDSTINPGADELCATVGVDDDCDGSTDEGDAADAVIWYEDADGDGYGSLAGFAKACEVPEGYTDNTEDCDDDASSTYPGADEYCDEVDSDCDGLVYDSDSVDANIYWIDGDSDGYGDSTTTTTACFTPSGYAKSGEEDCDDADSSKGPPEDWYTDADSDGYGDANATAVSSCSDVSGSAANDGDCDDTDPDLNPDTVWYRDVDGDGFGDETASVTQCEDPSDTFDYLLDGTDCDDFEGTTYPGAEELCASYCKMDEADNDCDGDIDEECPQVHGGVISADETWSADDDHLVICDTYIRGTSSAARPVITVEAGATVQVDPGVQISIGSDTGTGNIDIQGTSTSPVVFESSEASPNTADWAGFAFEAGADASTVEGLQLRHAGYAGMAIKASGATVSFTDVEVSETDGDAYYLTDFSTTSAGSYTVSGGTVSGTTTGLYYASTATGGSMDVDGLTVSSTDSYGIYISGTSATTASVTVSNTAVSGMTGGDEGIAMSDAGAIDLTIDASSVDASGSHGFSAYTESGTVTITDSTFSNNPGYGALIAAPSLDVQDSTFTGNQGYGLYVNAGSTRITGSEFSDTTVLDSGGASSEAEDQLDGDGLYTVQPIETLTGNTWTSNARCGLGGSTNGLDGLPTTLASDNSSSDNGLEGYICALANAAMTADTVWQDIGMAYLVNILYVYGDEGTSYTLTLAGAEVEVLDSMYVGDGYESGGAEVAKFGTLVGDGCSVTSDGYAINVGANGTLELTDCTVDSFYDAVSLNGAELSSGGLRYAEATLSNSSVYSDSKTTVNVGAEGVASINDSALESDGAQALYVEASGEATVSSTTLTSSWDYAARLYGRTDLTDVTFKYSGSGSSASIASINGSAADVSITNSASSGSYAHGLLIVSGASVTASDLDISVSQSGISVSNSEFSASGLDVSGAGNATGMYVVATSGGAATVDLTSSTIDGFSTGAYISGSGTTFSISSSSTSTISNNTVIGTFCTGGPSTSIDVSYSGNGWNTDC